MNLVVIDFILIPNYYNISYDYYYNYLTFADSTSFLHFNLPNFSLKKFEKFCYLAKFFATIIANYFTIITNYYFKLNSKVFH